jgi:opacity protein-like surface antigen/outer membrane protease
MHPQAVRLSALALVSVTTVWSSPVRGHEPAPYDWTGYYIGAHMGSGHANTSVANPFGLTLYGDEIPTQEALIGLQGGYNWQLPNTRWVFGAEGELTFLDTAGSNTCFAFNSAFYISSNCTNDPTYMGTLAARAGYAAGPSGKSLLYLKAGTAFIDNRLVAETNNEQIPNATPARRTAYTTSWGVLIGAGLEQAIAPAWTLKFEYDYMRTGDFGFAAPPSNNAQLDDAFTVTTVPGRATHAHLDNSLFKVGLNYRFGENALAQWGASGSIKPFASAGWSFEPVLRYWRSTGRFQKDLAAEFFTERRLVSRLTYDGLTANTNEIGARLDSPWLLFLKGYYGSGQIIGGHMNDEDWYYPFNYDNVDVRLGYSNTLSILRDSGQRYYTIDAGVDIIDGPDYRVGVFGGYNHIFESYGAMTCLSIASVMCYGEPHDYKAFITETDKWDSLRIGLAGDMWLTQGLKFALDAAYLPYVRFSGFDNHWLRPIIFNEHGNGTGMQLEAMLSYYFTERFSLGLGARYWSLWTTSGTDASNKTLTNRPVPYTYERYGVLAQATYRFD